MISSEPRIGAVIIVVVLHPSNMDRLIPPARHEMQVVDKKSLLFILTGFRGI
jgi:hypothetical protein